MGLNLAYLDFIQECVESTIGELSGKRMLELGNQVCDESIPEKTGKEYYMNRGVEHISVDFNGMDGALRMDLSKPDAFSSWHGSFDIVTNCGTSEHVEPKEAQYACFMIVHDCLRVGGISIHIVPGIDELKNEGCWKSHCRNYYSRDFFKMLATNNDYKLVCFEIINGFLSVCLQKQYDKPFMEEEEELLKYISRTRRGFIDPIYSFRQQGLIQGMLNKSRFLRESRLLRRLLGLCDEKTITGTYVAPDGSKITLNDDGTCALEDAENGDTTSGTYEEAENDITLTLADGSVRKAVYSAGGIVYSGTYYPTKDTRKL